MRLAAADSILNGVCTVDSYRLPGPLARPAKVKRSTESLAPITKAFGTDPEGFVVLIRIDDVLKVRCQANGDDGCP